MAKPGELADSAVRPGRLSVVATPIGNLGDLTGRARRVLADCDLIAAEDTRHTRVLLRHAGIDKPLLSLHQYNERERAAQLLGHLRGGAHVALVSDAGTPAISDPGMPLVRACVQAGIRIEPVPGPCAAIAALSISGLPSERFCFEGFLPAAAGARATALRQLAGERRTLVFYEAPHRIVEMLDACAAILGGVRQAMLARELTKQFETIYRGSLHELQQRARSDADVARGELVLVISGAPDVSAETADVELDRVLRTLLAELPLKQAAGLAARLTGSRANHAYRRALQLQREDGMD